jgi:uncharacterized protein YceH (UPF0502 family)
MDETARPEIIVYGGVDADPVVLNAIEVRVLGSLVEKQVTTPDYYPLTLNALVNACNQTSSRDPVVSYDEPTVTRAVDSLREKKLAFVFSGAESRVLKYGNKLAERFELTPAETAALCLLLLRGPQTVGEIRNRSGRLHEFSSLAEVESNLESLALKRPQALVTRLPRQTGLKESRFAHLLSGTAASPAESASSASIMPPEPDRLEKLENEVATLRQELAEVRRQFAEFRKQFE